jgi:hypothetical protein
MPSPRRRTKVPAATAAQVQFLSDRTCCVCRTSKKSTQLHHLDADPSNHNPTNLALLCLDCHNDTQMRGGFGRKLDAEQIALYRSDWYELVAAERESSRSRAKPQHNASSFDIKMATFAADAYRDNKEWGLLARHYDHLGQTDLRDKYVEKALEEHPRDQWIVILRGLQGRPDLIPADVKEREAARYEANKDWSQRARFWKGVGEPEKAAADYARSVLESLEEGKVFSAAYYLRELGESRLHRDLYFKAFEKAVAEGDLWWQARALQDLGSQPQYKAWLLEHADAIEQDGKPALIADLADATDDTERATKIRQGIIASRRTIIMDVIEQPTDVDDNHDGENDAPLTS